MAGLNKSVYTKVNRKSDNGIKCNFTMTKRPKGTFTIVQNIDVHIYTVDADGIEDNYKKRYSELWVCKPRCKANADLVDYFLIPTSWRRGLDGFYKVVAEAYLVKQRPKGYVAPKIKKSSRKKRKRSKEGDEDEEEPITHIDSDGTKRPGLPPWGTQPGRWDAYVPDKKKVLAGLTRVIKMEWSNITNSRADLSAGADLEVTMDNTHTHK